MQSFLPVLCRPVNNLEALPFISLKSDPSIQEFYGACLCAPPSLLLSALISTV